MSPTSVILFQEMLKTISPSRTTPIQRFKEGIQEIVFIITVLFKSNTPFATLRTLRTRIIPVQGSCGASLNGEFWIIGGWNEGRQVFITVNVSQSEVFYSDQSIRWMQAQKNRFSWFLFPLWRLQYISIFKRENSILLWWCCH